MPKVLPWFLFTLLSACASKSPEKEAALQSLGFELVSMGSIWSFRLSAEEAQEAEWWDLKLGAQRILEDYDRTFSAWRKDSELSKLRGKTNLPAQSSSLMREGVEFAAEAKRISAGAFDIVGPQGFDFNGSAKGHVVAALAVFFLEKGLRSFRIDGGGSSQAFLGKFIPTEHQKVGRLLFRSASSATVGDKQHIFDRRNPQRKITGNASLLCWVDLSKNPEVSSTRRDDKQIKFVGALSDALTKALLVSPKGWTLPNFCQELQLQEIKFSNLSSGYPHFVVATR